MNTDNSLFKVNGLIKRIQIGITMSIVFSMSILYAQGPSAAEYGVVLNLSGKQRMLTQKMSKECLLISLNIDKAKNLENLSKSSTLFDRTLKGLRSGDKGLRLPPTTSTRILRQLGVVDGLWSEFNKPVSAIIKSGEASKEQIAAIAAKNLPLLKNMNKCVKLYEKDASKAGLKSDPGLAVTINLSGKQRMLTQKMSKEFLLVAYGHDVDGNKLNLMETFTLFETTLKGLMDGDENLDLPGTKNKTIRDQLSVVTKLWKAFKPKVEYAADPAAKVISTDKIKALAGENLPLLKEMNKAVGMYEKEATK